MCHGGNRRLKEYFVNYDLVDENVIQQYNSKAAEHYRLKIRGDCDGNPISESAPMYEQGRQQVELG